MLIKMEFASAKLREYVDAASGCVVLGNTKFDYVPLRHYEE